MICKKCKIDRQHFEFSARVGEHYKNSDQRGLRKSGFRSICKSCIKLYLKEWREKNPDHNTKRRDYLNSWCRKNRGKMTAKATKRKAAILQRLPKWLAKEHLDKIKEIYIEARAISCLSGIPQDVDHIFPLLGKTVSGLHTPENLQILPMHLNRVKSNKVIGG